MTCIAGVAANGKVCIGGDSAGIAGWSLQTRADEKVFRNGPFVMGFCGSFRMGQLLRFKFKPPDHDPRLADYKFMVTEFIDQARQCLKDGGFASKDKEQETGGTFLVGYKQGLYLIDSDYQVGRPALDFAAVGAGDQVALGALHVLDRLPPRERVEKALAAAEAHNAAVRGPFVIEEV